VESKTKQMPKLLVTTDDVRPYIGAAPDAAKSRELTQMFRRLRKERTPLYLERGEFIDVARWKLLNQYDRVAKLIEGNSASTIQVITRAAFALQEPDACRELHVRVKVLSALDGVAIGVASAILALAFPEDYPVIDFRGWRQAYGETRKTFTVAHYAHYMDDCTRLAVQLGVFPQDVDLGLWTMDHERKGHSVMPRKADVAGTTPNIDDDPFNADWTKRTALDGYTPESFLTEFAAMPSDQFKRHPCYHMNKYRNPWIRTLDW
jgi:hypothetical protein